MNDLTKEKLAELRIWLVSAITAFFGIISYIWSKPVIDILYISSYFALVADLFIIVVIKLTMEKTYGEIK